MVSFDAKPLSIIVLVFLRFQNADLGINTPTPHNDGSVRSTVTNSSIFWSWHQIVHDERVLSARGSHSALQIHACTQSRLDIDSPLFNAFKLTMIVDQNGRRITLLGTVHQDQALLTAERASFPSEQKTLEEFHAAIHNIRNLGNNDIYRWYLASSGVAEGAPPDLKLNLIYPCTEKHVKKYSPQQVRMVTETPEIYKEHVRPYMQKMRDEGRLNWVFNILEGRAEQEDILLRDDGTGTTPDEGFIVAPDLNWDRKTLTSLHLLAMVERRDIWSLRDLKKSHVEWLKHMREKIINATVKLYSELNKDEIKLYVHCKHVPYWIGWRSLIDCRPAYLLSLPRSCCSCNVRSDVHASGRESHWS